MSLQSMYFLIQQFYNVVSSGANIQPSYWYNFVETYYHKIIVFLVNLHQIWMNLQWLWTEFFSCGYLYNMPQFYPGLPGHCIFVTLYASRTMLGNAASQKLFASKQKTALPGIYVPDFVSKVHECSLLCTSILADTFVCSWISSSYWLISRPWWHASIILRIIGT